MFIKKILLASALTFGFAAFQPALTHADEGHGAHAQHEKAAQPVKPYNREEALNSIRAAVDYMGESLKAENQASLFSDGPVMETLHEKTIAMQDSVKALETEADKMESDKGKRLKAALKQLTERADAFHAATHDKNAGKATAEVTKAKGALKLVESSLK